MFSEATEMPWLWAGLAAYALAAFYAFRGIAQQRVLAAGTRSYEGLVLLFMVCGVVLLAVSLGVRWVRIGHGPFVNLFELLVSQLFSLGTIYTLVYWRLPLLRPGAIVSLPIIWVLGLWVLMIEPKDAPFPPTYYNDWLWAHVGFGKIFLAFSMVGSGLAGVILLRWIGWFASWLRHLPADDVLDRYAWRFMVLALVFDSLMLIAGAVWAQDAWGRFWSWDALETSAFLTWLALGGAIHARLAWNVPIRLGAAFILIIFVVAFMTYFSTPFISEAVHKGVI